MKIMIDTNVIISAILFPKGKAAQAFKKAVSAPYEPMVCDYIVDELRRKFTEKFPEDKEQLDIFLNEMFKSVEVVTTPKEKVSAEKIIRDVKDRPILRAVLHEGAELFITGDKDFLESEVEDTKIISVSDFLEV